ncbi:hypothetical protein PoB_001090200, partial [Plakobranchus ocellatus]
MPKIGFGRCTARSLFNADKQHIVSWKTLTLDPLTSFSVIFLSIVLSSGLFLMYVCFPNDDEDDDDDDDDDDGNDNDDDDDNDNDDDDDNDHDDDADNDND